MPPLLLLLLLHRRHAVQPAAAADRGGSGEAARLFKMPYGRSQHALCSRVTCARELVMSGWLLTCLLWVGVHVWCVLVQVEESHWRDLLLQRFGPLLQANKVSFKLDVLTDYGTDPLAGVASAVVSTAEQLDAAALVVCGHSKGTFAEWLLGSVSDYAVHHAAVPVVVLHGPEYAPDGV